MPAQDELTISMLAKRLGVSRTVVWRRVKRGEIAARMVGKTYVITDPTVREMLDGKLNDQAKKQIEAAVLKTISEYGDVLKKLGRE